MKLPAVIHINHDNLRNQQQQIYLCTTAPFVMGKLVKIDNQDAALDFGTKQVSYSIKRIPGYNIFITYAGTMDGNEKISDCQIETGMNTIVAYYKNDILPNSYNVKKKYAIK